MSELIKQASKRLGKDNASKIHSVGNVLLTKSEVSVHKTIKRIFSFPVGNSIINVLYGLIALKKNRARMLKSPSVLEKSHLDDMIVFASNIIDK